MRAALLLLLPLLQESPEALLERLKTEDAAERRKIQEELLRRGREAVPAAVRALENAAPDPAARVRDLVRQLGAKAWKERNEAMRALSGLGRGAKSALEAEAQAATDPEVAWRARAALAEIQDRAGQDERVEDFRALALCEYLGEAGDARAVPVLLRTLLTAPEAKAELRRRAAEALGKLRERMEPAQADDASEKILGLLERTPSARDKSVLVRALAGLRSPAGVRPLAALLADRSEKNVNLKRSCMAALAASGEARGLKAVVDALLSDDVYLRQGAQTLLEEAWGEALGFDPLRPAEANRAAIEKARAGWSRKFGRPWED
jgi:hypothetical protein